nr:aquaporin-9 [Anolis sagrei ordinatus]
MGGRSGGKKERSWKRRLALRNKLAKEALAEFLATLIMIALGCGCVAQSVLSGGALGGPHVASFSFALAVTIAVYTAGGVSGGHINPAVSFAMCLTGRMTWDRFPIYVAAQFLGAFAGSALVFGINYEGLMAFTGGSFNVTGPKATAHIFATYPQEYLSLASGFADQVTSTCFLLLGVFAIFDQENLGVPRGLEPLAVGLLVILLSSSMSINCGCAMNPARDLAPRLFTYLAGWGPQVFTAGNHWWWVPLVAPMVGAALGAALYILFIELHHSPHQDPPALGNQVELKRMDEEEKRSHQRDGAL